MNGDASIISAPSFGATGPAACRPARTEHILRVEQHFRHPPDHIFAFFADAHNLNLLTPPWLQFRILTPGPIPLAAGTLIDYRLRLRGVPMRWRTRIAAWEPPHRFVDEQLRGPYAQWRHEHAFEPDGRGGTLVRDTVTYRLPLAGLPGMGVVHRVLVRPDLERIFAYRRSVLAQRFGA